MAREDVNIKVSANVAEAIALWRAMEEGPKGMANELEGLGRKGKRANESMSEGLDKVIGKWTSLKAAIDLAVKGIQFAIQANRQFQQESAEAQLSEEKSRIKLGLQANVTGAPLDALRGRLFDVAKQRGGIPRTIVEAIATQLASSGAARADLVSGTDIVLQIAAATSADISSRGGAKELTEALALSLSATGQDLTAANLSRLGVTTQRLIKGTNLQIGLLGGFAQVQGELTAEGGISQEDQLTMFALLTQVAGQSERGRTAFKTFVNRLATAGRTPVARKALGELGIDPEEVDLVGETITEVLGTLKAGFANVAAKERAGIAKDIFGTEAGLARTTFLAPGFAEQFAKKRAAVGDVAAFQADVLFAETGVGPVLARESLQQQRALARAGGADVDVVRQRMRTASLERGESGFFRALGRATFETLQFLGVDPDISRDFGEGANISRQGRRLMRGVLGTFGEERIETVIRLEDPDGITIPTEVDAVDAANREVGAPGP
ncbi:MAG: phage tail tape measure protein [Planctomycetota bacterium]|nr:phage tail tape measure protein [Planctomycetota bacterium]